MQTMRAGSDTILVIHCSGDSYLGRLVGESVNELSREGRISSVKEINDIKKLMTGADRCIAVDGCEKACMGKRLEEQNCDPELHLTLSDLGLEDRGDSPCLAEDLELSKDAIIAFSTRISAVSPALPGCCCC